MKKKRSLDALPNQNTEEIEDLEQERTERGVRQEIIENQLDLNEPDDRPDLHKPLVRVA